MPESPQFVVLLSKWDAAPKLTDDTFKFVPPQGAQQIQFLQTSAAAPATK